MQDILTLLRAAPTLVKAASQVQKAANGDSEALEYIKRDGWAELLDLARPGMADNVREAAHHARHAAAALGYGLNGQVIEGEYRVINSPPWEGFLGRLMKARCGGHIILGPIGQGKTTLAKRLAQRYHEEHGYKVEAINMYPEDVPEFASIVGIDTLIKRMRRLGRYLRELAEPDEDEICNFEEDGEGEELGPVTLPPRRRVIIIDEAILSMSSNPNDPARKAALQALAQCRHLDWVVIYIGQWAGQLPLALLGMCTVWVKKPSGREALTDRDHPVVKDLWRRTEEAFANLKSSQWYQEPWLDSRSWAYVDCQSLNGAKGYTGLIPFSMPEDMESE